MNSEAITLRFSGHDTFHCKEQWILKGLQLIDFKKDRSIFQNPLTITELGVGKNMVRSIQHWLRSFGLVNDDLTPTEFANIVFLNDKLDPYLEYDGSLWLLQYYICKTQYASIFKMIFDDYFADKATLEFSEYQIWKFIENELREKNQKSISDKTFDSDFKVFIRSYLAPANNHKTVEDDFNVPLIALNLVNDTERLNDSGQKVYWLNKKGHDVPIEIFAYCFLTEFNNQSSIDFDEVRRTLGSYFCLSNDKLDEMLYHLPTIYKEFVYNEDAGIRQMQLKVKKTDFRNNILKKYYELH